MEIPYFIDLHVTANDRKMSRGCHLITLFLSIIGESDIPLTERGKISENTVGRWDTPNIIVVSSQLVGHSIFSLQSLFSPVSRVCFAEPSKVKPCFLIQTPLISMPSCLPSTQPDSAESQALNALKPSPLKHNNSLNERCVFTVLGCNLV